MIGMIYPGLSLGVGLGLAVPGGVADEPDFHPAPGGSAGGSPAGTLPLPASPEAVAWAAFVDRVTLDPTLRDLVRFRTWSGESGDDAAPGSADEMPWIRFSPMAGKGERWSTGNVWYRPIVVHCDVMTAGLGVVDAMNLWGLVVSVVESSAFKAAMSAAGVTCVEATEGGWGVRPNNPKYEPEVAGSLFAAGSITIDLYVEYTD